MAQIKLENNSPEKANSGKDAETGNNRTCYQEILDKITHIAFVSFFLLALIDLLLNGNLATAFEDVEHELQNGGFDFGTGVIVWYLWFSVVSLVIEAALHVRMCLLHLTHTQINETDVKALIELVWIWGNFTGGFIIGDLLAIVVVSLESGRPHVQMLLVSHVCSLVALVGYYSHLKMMMFNMKKTATNKPICNNASSIAVEVNEEQLQK